MKKTALALSIACAGALAFADNPQWNTAAWITGIGFDASSLTRLDATGGSWSGLSTDNAELTESNAIELDLDTTEEALFSVTATTTEKTAQKLTITGVFTPTAAADLLNGTAMGSGEGNKNAQFGFAVVSTTTEATDNTDATTTYGYYAWVGTSGSSTPIEDWTKIADCSDPTAETTVEIQASYWAGTPKVTFTIGNESATYPLTGDAATAAAANKIASVACTGSGTLSTLSGVTGIAVASVGDTVYPTVADAITAATASGATDTTVKLEADPDGEVTIADGASVKIDDNGKTAEIKNNGTVDVAVKSDDISKGSGTYTYPLNVSGGTVQASTTDSSKEVTATVDTEKKEVTLTVQTKASILTGIQFGNKAVTKDSTISGFRTFLTANCKDAYEKANTSSDAIKDALAANGDNALPLWQSYALGVTPTTDIKPTNVTKDTAATEITLAIPAVTPTGDYTVYLTVGENTADKKVEYKSGVTSITVPVDTGKYPIVLSFE